MLLDDFGIVEMQVGVCNGTENLLRYATVFIRLNLESLLFEFLVFLETFLLDLPDFLHFALDSLLFFCLMSVPLNSLDGKLGLIILCELDLTPPFSLAGGLFALEKASIALISLFHNISLLLLNFPRNLLYVG